jgi:hypothetical protein
LFYQQRLTLNTRATRNDAARCHQENLLSQVLLSAAARVEKFYRIHEWRRIATRHDELARSVLAGDLVNAFYCIKLCPGAYLRMTKD